MHSRPTRRAHSLALGAILAGFVSGNLIGCGEDSELCAEGSLGCVCDEGASCSEGLVCEADLCVSESEDEPGATAGASGGTDSAQGEEPNGAGASNGEGGSGGTMSVDSSDPEDPEEGVAGQGSDGAAGAANGGSGGGGSGDTDGSGGTAGGSGGAGGGGAGGSGGSGGAGGSGGETSQFPGSCFGCYVEFGCLTEHLACNSDPDCAPCVASGYSASVCNANPAFQALMACACESVCQTPCADVCE